MNIENNIEKKKQEEKIIVINNFSITNIKISDIIKFICFQNDDYIGFSINDIQFMSINTKYNKNNKNNNIIINICNNIIDVDFNYEYYYNHKQFKIIINDVTKYVSINTFYKLIIELLYTYIK